MNDRLTLAHLSDLHVGTVSDHDLRHLAADVRAQAPQFIVITGDLTQWGKSKEFARARQFIEMLPGTCLIVPGNHDISAFNPLERFARPFHRFKREMARPLEPIYLDSALCIVGLNSARRMLARFNWSHGVISHRQIAWLRSALDQAGPGALRIIAMHHPVIGTPGAVAGIAVKRSEQFLKAAAEAKCDLILTGHGHRHGARALNAPHVSRPLVAVSAGAAVSPRRRDEENSYAVITYNGAMTVEQRLLRRGDWQASIRCRFERTNSGWCAVKPG